ncbi:MAG: hypothetical protein HUU34_23130, partial [Saprospiraceae bacterium]|nr:hypothetical protein [Saprospiraceae bacterium]
MITINTRWKKKIGLLGVSGSGTVVVAQENLENIIPAEKNIRIEFGGMQDKTAHL